MAFVNELWKWGAKVDLLLKAAVRPSELLVKCLDAFYSSSEPLKNQDPIANDNIHLIAHICHTSYDSMRDSHHPFVQKHNFFPPHVFPCVFCFFQLANGKSKNMGRIEGTPPRSPGWSLQMFNVELFMQYSRRTSVLPKNCKSPFHSS